VSDIVLRWVPADHPVAVALAAEQQRDLTNQSPQDKLDYALHEDIEFVVVERDGRPIACGALQRLDHSTGEIKRMYVVPDERRSGLARTVVTAIEDRARERGITRLRLETAPAFTAAVALYRSGGYVEIPAYGEYVGNPISFCMERELEPR
jgi:putative acetyltransferase